jgi:two-component system alkaline phosphatase synthesis response regulator PhoP
MSTIYRILIVEDERHLAQGLRFNLEAEGYEAEIVGDGIEALRRLNGSHDFDVVVLDVMLPGKNGFEVAQELRAAQNFVPILMLTARGRPEDVLNGFAAGADDYLPKPFELPILLARIHGLLRRAEWQKRGASSGAASASPTDEEIFRFNGKSVDFNTLQLHANGRSIQLTLMEAELLRHLIRNRDKAVSRNSILENVWGLREDTDTRAIDNFIVRLRRYIEEDATKPKYLLTVRGVGYRFVPQPEGLPEPH